MRMIKHHAKGENYNVMLLSLNAEDSKINKAVPLAIEENIPVCPFFITMHGYSLIESFCFHRQHIFYPTRKPRIPGDCVTTNLQKDTGFAKPPAPTLESSGGYLIVCQYFIRFAFRQNAESKSYNSHRTNYLASTVFRLGEQGWRQEVLIGCGGGCSD